MKREVRRALKRGVRYDGKLIGHTGHDIFRLGGGSESGSPVTGGAASLASSRVAVRTMMKAVRKGFRAIAKTGTKVTPFALRTIFTLVLVPFAVRYRQRQLAGPVGTVEPIYRVVMCTYLVCPLRLTARTNRQRHRSPCYRDRMLSIRHESSVRLDFGIDVHVLSNVEQAVLPGGNELGWVAVSCCDLGERIQVHVAVDLAVSPITVAMFESPPLWSEPALRWRGFVIAAVIAVKSPCPF